MRSPVPREWSDRGEHLSIGLAFNFIVMTPVWKKMSVVKNLPTPKTVGEGMSSPKIKIKFYAWSLQRGVICCALCGEVTLKATKSAISCCFVQTRSSMSSFAIRPLTKFDWETKQRREKVYVFQQILLQSPEILSVRLPTHLHAQYAAIAMVQWFLPVTLVQWRIKFSYTTIKDTWQSSVTHPTQQASNILQWRRQ